MSIKWHSANRKHPCPICGKPDWCTTNSEGTLCACYRVQSPHPTKAGLAWLHSIDAKGKAPGEGRTSRRTLAPSRYNVNTPATGMPRRDKGVKV